MKNLKKISSTLFLLVTLAITFTSCDKDDDDDNNKNVLKFNPAKVEVATGKTASVTVSGGLTPYIVALQDQKIATVKVNKSTITIAGVSKGATIIEVMDKNKNRGTLSVTVKDAAAGLELDKKTLNVSVGKEDVVTVKNGVAPYAAVSKDAGIATATVKDSKVTIKAVKVGTTTITVTDKDKKNSGTISVTVKDDATGGLELDKKTLNVNIGKEDVVTIKGGVAPYAAVSKNAGIATATLKDSKVTIKGIKAGTTTITVTDKDKKNSATISVTVK